VQRTPGGIEIRAPKYGSERQVFLAPSLVSMLSEHLASIFQDDPAGWLLAGEGYEPPPPNTVDHRWRTLRKRAGVSEGIRLHDMRHFYASGLIAAGCDVVTVQRALGHASATTTLNTYSHLRPTAEDRTRSAAEGLVLATLSPVFADSTRTTALR
jgi:integrase